MSWRVSACQERIKNFQEKRTAAEGSRRAKTAAKRSAQNATKRENKRKGIKAKKKGREGAIAAAAAAKGGAANGSAEGACVYVYVCVCMGVCERACVYRCSGQGTTLVVARCHLGFPEIWCILSVSSSTWFGVLDMTYLSAGRQTSREGIFAL